MTAEQEILLSKIILETATGEDFSALKYDFDETTRFFKNPDVISTLDKFSIFTNRTGSYIDVIHRLHDPTYCISIYTGAYRVCHGKVQIYDARDSI